jgi:hypothetical protein
MWRLKTMSRNSSAPPEPGAILTEAHHRAAVAYHEAGHAVMALWHGWQISPEDVEIDAREYTGTRCLVCQRNLEGPWTIICLAGWLSEHKWHRRGPSSQYPEFDDLEGLINDVRFGHEEDSEGDEGDVIRHLLELHPHATDADLMRLYRQYEQRTAELLNVPFVWFAIERFATELLKRGKIGARRSATLWRMVQKESIAAGRGEVMAGS